MAKEMNKLDKAALRKIKESGNYGALLKFKRLKPKSFQKNCFYFLYCAIRKPDYFAFKSDNMYLEDFFEKNGIKFVF